MLNYRDGADMEEAPSVSFYFVITYERSTLHVHSQAGLRCQVALVEMDSLSFDYFGVERSLHTMRFSLFNVTCSLFFQRQQVL
jgi:hypothetical protein